MPLLSASFADTLPQRWLMPPHQLQSATKSLLDWGCTEERAESLTCSLSLRPSERLMDHDARIGQRIPLPLHDPEEC